MSEDSQAQPTQVEAGEISPWHFLGALGSVIEEQGSISTEAWNAAAAAARNAEQLGRAS